MKPKPVGPGVSDLRRRDTVGLPPTARIGQHQGIAGPDRFEECEVGVPMSGQCDDTVRADGRTRIQVRGTERQRAAAGAGEHHLSNAMGRRFEQRDR